MRELILGGGKSGKSGCAERRAAQWLAAAGHESVLIATAQAGDDEMQARIARHRTERAQRVPMLQTLEVPLALPEALREASAPHRMVLVDCLTLWLTQHLSPLHGPALDEQAWLKQQDALLAALQAARGPVVLVSNEISLGLAPLGRELRRTLDALGLLHQRVAAVCERVTLMVAGLELRVKP